MNADTEVCRIDFLRNLKDRGGGRGICYAYFRPEFAVRIEPLQFVGGIFGRRSHATFQCCRQSYPLSVVREQGAQEAPYAVEIGQTVEVGEGEVPLPGAEGKEIAICFFCAVEEGAAFGLKGQGGLIGHGPDCALMQYRTDGKLREVGQSFGGSLFEQLFVKFLLQGEVEDDVKGGLLPAAGIVEKAVRCAYGS